MSLQMIRLSLLVLACIAGIMSGAYYHDIGGMIGSAIGFGFGVVFLFDASRAAANGQSSDG